MLPTLPESPAVADDRSRDLNKIDETSREVDKTTAEKSCVVNRGAGRRPRSREFRANLNAKPAASTVTSTVLADVTMSMQVNLKY